jgi:hypothetical protein
MGLDKYDRVLAHVECGGIEVNAEQLRRGWAWVYAQYSQDETLRSLERSARLRRLGLWAAANPQPPWTFRHEEESRRLSSPPSAYPRLQPSKPGRCGFKRTCKDMASCDEARYYLRYCGLAALDGNHDGVPCASLCGPSQSRR